MSYVRGRQGEAETSRLFAVLAGARLISLAVIIFK